MTDFAPAARYPLSMKILYADTLVALNAAVDYLLLLSSGKLCALPLRRRRIALGAFWGGAYALLAAAYPRFWALWSVKLAAGAACVLLAYGFERRTPRALAAFFAVSAAFGGISRFLSSLRGEPAGLSARVLLLSFAVCYGVIALLFRRVGKREAGAVRAVVLSRNGKEVRLQALEDSGNALVDPLSGDAVIVAEAAALAPLFPDPAPLYLDAPEALARLEGEAARGARLLPCSCVTAPRALLLCFRPERVTVEGKERRDLLIAVSPNRLSPEGRYNAIM